LNRNTGIHRIGVITFSFFVRLWIEYVREGGGGERGEREQSRRGIDECDKYGVAQ